LRWVDHWAIYKVYSFNALATAQFISSKGFSMLNTTPSNKNILSFLRKLNPVAAFAAVIIVVLAALLLLSLLW